MAPDAALRRRSLLRDGKYRALGTAHALDLDLAITPGLLEFDFQGVGSSVLDLDGEPVLSPSELGRPVLLGGYHGVWVPGGALRSRRIASEDLAGLGARLGAGVVLPLPPGLCPVHETARIVSYLAGESAQRCGPCRFGLPTLALAVEDVDRGVGAVERIDELAGVLSGRGACAHPDGTVRLVASLQRWFPEELRLHQRQECNHGALAPTG